ncbi:hypothetical protein ACT80S_01775 [Ramlibacter sp. MAHUQ-53]|uniref:hypothetical protein n=1 Tax=unclassified Ramlibacter TaxID=2617605 RepID=UPI003628C231
MPTHDQLLHILRTWGRQPAGELVSRLGVSRPTLMRAVRALGPQVVALGRARRSAYAARRALRGDWASLPVYRIDESGQAHEAATLSPLHPGGCAVDWREPCPWPLDADMADGWFDGLPYLLDDLRPQGFLGRHFARQHAPLLQLPADPAQWSEDDTLHALSLVGGDAPGCYVLGEPALRGWLAAVRLVRAQCRPARAARAGLGDGRAGPAGAGLDRCRHARGDRARLAVRPADRQQRHA